MKHHHDLWLAFLLILFVQFECRAGDVEVSLEKPVSISGINQKYEINAPVKFDIKVHHSLLVDGKLKYKCHIYSYVEAEKRYAETIPSLIAKAPKQLEPTYSYPKDNKLTWDYSNSPNYFKPIVGISYVIVISIENAERKKTLYSSDAFVFNE